MSVNTLLCDTLGLADSFAVPLEGPWILSSNIAIPVALYRPQTGPPARNGEKMAEKWSLAQPGKRGKNGRNMGKNGRKWENWPKNGSKMAIFPFFGQCFPFFFLVGPESVFRPFFSPISGRRPDLGSVQGNRDRKANKLLRGGGWRHLRSQDTSATPNSSRCSRAKARHVHGCVMQLLSWYCCILSFLRLEQPHKSNRDTSNEAKAKGFTSMVHHPESPKNSLISGSTPEPEIAEPRGEEKLLSVQILGGEKLLKFVEKCRWNIFKRPERG